MLEHLGISDILQVHAALNRERNDYEVAFLQLRLCTFCMAGGWFRDDLI